MRLLMISWEYPPHMQGGLGRHVLELLPALRQNPGVTIHLVTPRFGEGEAYESFGNLVIHRVDAPAPARDNLHGGAWHANNVLGFYIESLWRSVGGFDLVHAHDWLVSFAAVAVSRAYGVPLIVTIHATERGRNRGWLTTPLSQQIHDAETNLTQAANLIITASEFMRNEVQSFFGINGQKIRVIPNGVNTTPFDAARLLDHRLERQLYALPEEKIVFHIGRLVHEKGSLFLVEAVPAILRSFPNTKFVIAGRGPLMERLQQRAAELHITHKVLFPGFVSDEEAVRMFCIADAAVFPSLYEPFGLVALEAMAAKTPVIVTSVGGLAEVVQHDKTGVTVFPENVDSLVWGISRVLRNPEQARHLADNAYRLIKESYSWTAIASRTLAAYQGLVAPAAVA